MAGLSHNPAAEYCTKRGTSTDPDAVCDYCKARGLGPQEIGFDKGGELPSGVSTVANNTGEPEPVEPGKPLIAQFFERVGIVKGAVIQRFYTVDGERLNGPFEIVDIAAYLDQEVVISLRERGLSQTHRVVWSKVASYIV